MASEEELRRQFAVGFLLISIWNITINTFLIFALRRLKKLKSLSYKLMLCMTISDFGTSVSSFMEQILMLSLNQNMGGLQMKLFFRYVTYFFGQFSGFATIIIAFDRYVHMKFLTNYNNIMTNRRAVILIAVDLAISAFGCILRTMEKAGSASVSSSLIRTLLALFTFLIALGLYLRAFRAIDIRVRNLNLHTSIEVSPINPNNSIDGTSGSQINPNPNQGNPNNSINGTSGSQINPRQLDVNDTATECQSNPSQSVIRDNPGKPSVTKGNPKKQSLTRNNPNRQFAKCLIWILIILVFCYMPYFISSTVLAFSIESGDEELRNTVVAVRTACIIPVQMNAGLNAMCLILFDRQLRNYARSLFPK